MTQLKLFWTCKKCIVFQNEGKQASVLQCVSLSMQRKKEGEKDYRLFLIHFQCLEKLVMGLNIFSFCSIFFFQQVDKQDNMT